MGRSGGHRCSEDTAISGAKNTILCDRHGSIYAGRTQGINWIKKEMAELTNPEKFKGDLKGAIKESDVFLGFSAPLLQRIW